MKILIVEDDKAIRNLLSTALELHGYQHRSAETGKLSIQEILSYKPHLVILDPDAALRMADALTFDSFANF